MALLISLFFFVFPLNAGAPPDSSLFVLEEVLFDFGDAEKSVGIVGGKILEAGDLYKDYRVLTFEPDAIVMEDLRTFDRIKWVKEGEAGEEDIRRARNQFVVKQMRAIYEAQARYFHQWQEFAPDLETLIEHADLADGFEEGKKQNYFFEIAEIRAEFGKPPSFLAIASPPTPSLPLPLHPAGGGLGWGRGEGEGWYYFSVDELGLVRYADTRTQASWGPVWDYREDSGGSLSRTLWEGGSEESIVL